MELGLWNAEVRPGRIRLVRVHFGSKNSASLTANIRSGTLPPSMKGKLDERSLRVLRFIVQYQEKHGAPPTIREVGKHVGTVPSNALAILRRLQKKRLIRRDRKSRSLRVVGGEAYRSGALRIPILGRVAAGRPALQEQIEEGTLAIDPALARGGKCYALKVEGDSMINFGIHDGDFVVVRETTTAEDGDIVAALVDNENTVKRLRISGKGAILEPGNPKYKPIVTGNRDLRIQGKVLQVQRFF